jgi:hypothetical protein
MTLFYFEGIRRAEAVRQKAPVLALNVIIIFLDDNDECLIDN